MDKTAIEHFFDMCKTEKIVKKLIFIHTRTYLSKYKCFFKKHFLKIVTTECFICETHTISYSNKIILFNSI